MGWTNDLFSWMGIRPQKRVGFGNTSRRAILNSVDRPLSFPTSRNPIG
jgi:hypothetical protein